MKTKNKPELPSWINHNRSVHMVNYWTVMSWLIKTVYRQSNCQWTISIEGELQKEARVNNFLPLKRGCLFEEGRLNRGFTTIIFFFYVLVGKKMSFELPLERWPCLKTVITMFIWRIFPCIKPVMKRKVGDVDTESNVLSVRRT